MDAILRLVEDDRLRPFEHALADFLADMRFRNIKRNPWIDMGASMLGSYANNSAGRSNDYVNPHDGWLANDSRYAGPY